MRSVCAFLVLVTLLGCDRDDPVLRRSDGSVFSASGGEVLLSDGGRLEFGITSDRYRRWDAAQEAIPHAVAQRFGGILRPRSPTEQTIESAIAYLQRHSAASQAIERAGMSVREFVLMTVALEQEMQLAESRGEPAMQLPMWIDTIPLDTSPLPVPSPYPTPYTYPYPYPSAYPPDTMYRTQPVLPPPMVPPVTQADTQRGDTIFFNSAPRDTAVPRPSVRRDTIFLPSRRDTIRDTVTPPRDTTRPDTTGGTAAT